jgi:hypothetical protein
MALTERNRRRGRLHADVQSARRGGDQHAGSTGALHGPTDRPLSNHTGGIALGAMLVWLALVPSLTGAANEGIVSVQGGKFFLGANEFRFVGTNAYFMLDAATDGSRRHTDEMMKLANALEFTVSRTWAFLDGTKYGAALQPSPGVYNEAAFRELDYVLAKANEHGVRLILMLVNNWQEFGGITQYLEWCAPGEHKVAFYTKPSCHTSCIVALSQSYSTARTRRIPVITPPIRRSSRGNWPTSRDAETATPR